MPQNLLCYGDNLDILRRHIPDESVDLIYLDPPFNSKATYNVLFAEQDGSRAAAQMKAFEDTWHWDVKAVTAYQEVVEGGGRVAEALQAFHGLLGGNDMLAYLTMMAPRLVELRRVLKPSGSIYLHCDLTASHYLKILLDAVFRPAPFLNEITWRRTHSHGNVSRNFGSICDTILVYTKTDSYTWNQQYTPFSPEYIEATFKGIDPDGRGWRSVTLRNPGRRPNLHYPYKASNGVTYQPHPNGWSCDVQRMRKYDREKRLHFPKKPTGALRLKMYLDESPGVKLQNLWEDIPALAAKAAERLGYPTQKPEALLERIIQTSSNEGDTVLDPFCGCGTAVAAAQRLNRRWIGIDITHLAITLIRHRLQDAFGAPIAKQYQVTGEPTVVSAAAKLAEEDRFQFQWWALGLVGARPTPPEQKKGADKGVDGRLYFFDDPQTGKPKLIVFSVKSGHLKATDVRDLRGVIDREKAAIGVLITLEEPTKPMCAEAASVGSYGSPFAGHKVPRLQIWTVEQLLAGRGIDMPPNEKIAPLTKRAPKAKGRKAVETLLPFDGVAIKASDESE
jgi:site-specific DNA-methyltransferase (adenine-specific)